MKRFIFFSFGDVYQSLDWSKVAVGKRPWWNGLEKIIGFASS